MWHMAVRSYGFQTPTKDFALRSTTVYQTQTTTATTKANNNETITSQATTATTTTRTQDVEYQLSLQQQQQQQKNAKIADLAKMPATTAAATAASPVASLPPLEQTASGAGVNSGGGHSTPLAGQEVLLVGAELEQQLPTALTTSLQSPVAPIPKQRSLFLATTPTAAATAAGSSTATGSTATKSHYTKAEQETACKNYTAALSPTRGAASSSTGTYQHQHQHHQQQQQQQQQRVNSTNSSSVTAPTTTTNVLTLTTRLTSSGTRRERRAEHCSSYGVDEYEESTMTTTTLTKNTAQMQEQRNSASETPHKTKYGTKCGLHADGSQQEQHAAVIPSTTTADGAAAAPPHETEQTAKAFAASAHSSQSHGKCESEQTLFAQQKTSETSASSASTQLDTIEKTVISASCVSVGVVSGGKISSKLQSNQFIKNQQHTASSAGKYTKYKSHSTLQEASGSNNTGGAAASATSSPTKTALTNTATAATTAVGTGIATTTTSITGVNKKNMVSVQELKKTTQNVSHHHHLHHHHHHNNNHHQQHHQQQQQQQGNTCGRQQQQQQRSPHAVAAHENETQLPGDFDASEDLSYGPGIVSKLRCRYLTLALRESMKNQRNSLEQLRRATSLNNLLDREDHKHHDDDEDDDDELDADVDVVEVVELEDEVELRSATARVSAKHRAAVVGGGILKHGNVEPTAQSSPVDEALLSPSKKTATFLKNAAANNSTAVTNGARMSQSQLYGSAAVTAGKHQSTGQAVADASLASSRSRHVKRGNDSLKRARSVEALLCDKSPWSTTALHRTSYQYDAARTTGTTPGAGVTIEDKINNARDRLLLGTDTVPPKRLTSIIDDTERPPPDLVKQTLKLFEATANRRGRGASRTNGKGEVANKVANYKSIIKEQKPAIVFPKPPLSPTKKLSANSPVKPAAKPVVAASDLLSSPVGRKTFAATVAGAGGAQMSPTSDVPHYYASTPKQKYAAAGSGNSLEYATPLKTPASAIGSGLLSEHSPDIIPRQSVSGGNKLLLEKSEPFVVDSPVTALTKKLEKLRIEADKQLDVTTKESQAKQLLPSNKLAAAEPYGSQGSSASSAHEVNKDDVRDERIREHDRHDSDNNKSVVGGDAAPLVGGGAGGSGGDKKNERDRTAIASSAAALPTEPDDRTAQAGTAAAISSDLSDDEYGLTTKRVTKTALDNIAKAGTTQQFKFAAATTGGQTKSTAATIANGNAATTTTTTNTAAASNTAEKQSTSVLHAAPPGKQIGIIRPLLNTQSTQLQQQQQTTTTTSSTASVNNSIHSTHIQQQQQQQLLHMETLKQHSTYTQHTTSTYTASTAYSSGASSSSSSSSSSATLSSNSHIALTSREIEKNRINEMKKTALVDPSATISANNTSSITGSGASATAAHAVGTSLDTVINTKTVGAGSMSPSSANSSAPATNTSGFSELDAVNATNSPLWALRKRRQAQTTVTENTTMVFNFSNRKEVPDYIENDGVIFRRKRELPKPNESGFVLLGDLSLETSTDTDYDDFSMCPPSPCDVEFENANIVIDGKSSIRQKTKEAAFRVQFNDTLTSTFEYPSEASLVIEESFTDYYMNSDDLVNAYQSLLLEEADSPAHHHHVAVDEIIQLPTPAATPANSNSSTATPPTNNSTTNTPTKNVLGNLPLGSAPLGCYTPIKAPLDSLFQLGVTRAPPNSNGHAYNAGTAGGVTTNGNANGGEVANTNGLSNGGVGGGLGGSILGIKDGLIGDSEEPESLQYLKPANDDLTIAYSEGAQKTDLLY